MYSRSFLLLASVMYMLNTVAQTQLTNLPSYPIDFGSSPSDFIVFNDLLLFSARTESEGTELWIRDNTDTYLLKDIFPGNGNGIRPDYLDRSTLFKDRFYFIANDGEHGEQIWSTDGTDSGTSRITSIPGLDLYQLTVVEDEIFFLNLTGSGLQVWKTDGTAEGTQLVKDKLPIRSEPSYQGTANGLFFFTFQPPETEASRLWTSDGTEAGTFPVTGQISGNGSGPDGSGTPKQYIEFNGELYFVIRNNDIIDEETSAVIMKTDGSVENTIPVAGIYAGDSPLVSYTDQMVVNGKLYFYFYIFDTQIFNPEYSLQIWESDGTAGGTRSIFSESSLAYYPPSNLIADGNHLVFTNIDSVGNTTLMKLNLSDLNTEEVKVLGKYLDQPRLFQFRHLTVITQIPNGLFYIINPNNNYRDYSNWVSDLTTENTYSIHNTNTVREVIPFQGTIYFANPSEPKGTELWRLNEALTEPEFVVDINDLPVGLFSREYQTLKDKIFFYHLTDGKGMELWVYDTTITETVKVGEIRPSIGSVPNNIVALNDNLFYMAYTQDSGWELWQSDGTPSGTNLVEDFAPGTASSFPENLFIFQDQLFFTVDLEGDFYLARLNDSNIEIIKALGENQFGSSIRVREVAVANSYFYFVTYGAGEDLWRSDGTESGTLLLKDMSTLSHLACVDDQAFFSGKEPGQTDVELWQTDGSPANTTQVKNIGNAYSSNPGNFTTFNDKLIFTAYTQESGREYWISDGTGEGTFQLFDIATGVNNGAPQNTETSAGQYAILNDFLYFSAKDPINGTELWRTDGTPDGLQLVKDINPGPTGSFPHHLFSSDNQLYFTAYTPEGGVELWTSKGDEASTQQLYDLIEGPVGSVPQNLMQIGQELFFTAFTPDAGRQLWRADLQKLTGLEETRWADEIKIYPNPATEFIYLQNIHTPITGFQIHASDGRNIRTARLHDGSIYIGDLPEGIYFLVIRNNRKTAVKKFVKSNATR